MQDLRDCKGDALTGRVTVPLLLGEQRTRFLLCLGFVALPILVWFYLIAPVGITLSTLFWQLPVTIISVIIAVRVITRRNVEADHHTYMLFCYWYCLLLSSTMFIL